MPKQKIYESANALNLDEYVEKFLPECITGLDYGSEPYRISVESASSISPVDLQRCFDLIASTSEADYRASSGGWRPQKKLNEMRLLDMRYLLVHSKTTEDEKALVGFASFMLTREDGNEVIYLYEIHLTQSARGIGLGKKLIELVEEAGRRSGMDRIMLTVYLRNENARKFYTAQGFVTDASSPEPRTLRNGAVNTPDYMLLSKSLRQ